MPFVREGALWQRPLPLLRLKLVWLTVWQPTERAAGKGRAISYKPPGYYPVCMVAVRACVAGVVARNDGAPVLPS